MQFQYFKTEVLIGVSDITLRELITGMPAKLVWNPIQNAKSGEILCRTFFLPELVESVKHSSQGIYR